MLYRGPAHRGDLSGCKLVIFFGSDCDDGLGVVIGVQYASNRSGCKMVILFGSDCDDASHC